MPLPDGSFREVLRSLLGKERATDRPDQLVSQSRCFMTFSLCTRSCVATDLVALTVV